MKDIALKTKINDLTTQNIMLIKENKDLLSLINSQDRLIEKLKKQNEEYVLLLDECLKRRK